MKTERLRLKFIVCTMAVVTAAVLLSMAAALLAGGHMRRDLFRIQLMTGSVIWSCALVFSLFFPGGPQDLPNGGCVIRSVRWQMFPTN